MRFRKNESEDTRPAFSCCSVSLSISCCSLPSMAALLLLALVAWLGVRYGRDELMTWRRDKMLESPG